MSHFKKKPKADVIEYREGTTQQHVTALRPGEREGDGGVSDLQHRILQYE